MLQNKPVTINGSGEQVRDFIYVTDCAKANLMVLEKGSGKVYNLGFGIGTSINQVFSHLKRITGYTSEPIHVAAKAGETFRIYLDASRAMQELGWEPTYAIEDGLTNTVNYFRNHEFSA
jgi:UDP-glucose 4-epimerase